MESWNVSLETFSVTPQLEFFSLYLQESHEPRHKAVTCPLEDGEERGEEWRADDKSDAPALEKVCDEEAWGNLVEPMLLFEDKRLVGREGERWQGGDEKENKNERDGLYNLHGDSA